MAHPERHLPHTRLDRRQALLRLLAIILLIGFTLAVLMLLGLLWVYS